MRRVSIWGGMRMAARLASKGCAVSSGHRQAPPVRCGTVCARRPRTYAESRMRRCGICPQHPGSLQCSLHEVLGSGSPSFLLARTKAPRTQDCLRTVHATKHSGPTHSSCLSAECGVQFVVRGRRQRHWTWTSNAHLRLPPQRCVIGLSRPQGAQRQGQRPLTSARYTCVYNVVVFNCALPCDICQRARIFKNNEQL